MCTYVTLASFVNGRILDHNYRRLASAIGFTINTNSGDHLINYPVERARTRFSLIFNPVHTVPIIGYGRTARYHLPLSIPLILHFLLGFLQTCIVQTSNTLLVDIIPSSPSSASAAGDITHCALSAGAIAAVEALIRVTGKGWVFTMLGWVAGITSFAAVWVMRRKAREWRKGR